MKYRWISNENILTPIDRLRMKQQYIFSHIDSKVCKNIGNKHEMYKFPALLEDMYLALSSRNQMTQIMSG